MKKKLPYIIGGVMLVVGLGIWFVLSNLTCLMNDCNKFIQAGSEYCENHTCCLDDCNEKKSFESMYCGKHGCLEDNCTELVIEDERTSFYCEKHRCKVGNCGERIYLGDHCLLHDCSDEYCNEATEEFYSFCPKHKK